jgi:hypothetical protein
VHARGRGCSHAHQGVAHVDKKRSTGDMRECDDVRGVGAWAQSI